MFRTMGNMGCRRRSYQTYGSECKILKTGRMRIHLRREKASEGIKQSSHEMTEGSAIALVLVPGMRLGA